MTMLDHARPTVCPTWCRVDHTPPGVAGEWHSRRLNDLPATGLPGEPDDVLVSLEQYALDPTAAASIRVDIDRLGNVAFLTAAEALELAAALARAAAAASVQSSG